MYNHRTHYTLGDIVYVKTDNNQLARMVIGITLRYNSSPYYELGCGPESSFHFEIEMSADPDQNIKLGIEVEK